MAVCAYWSHVKLSSNLMEFITPMPTVSFKSNIKFRPAGMLYEKSRPNASSMFADLLHEQNIYLEEYGDFCLGDLHKAVLNFELNDGSTLWSSMHDEASIVDIHST
eukprot:13369370-Ditylum_brightwellii.AAC.1